MYDFTWTSIMSGGDMTASSFPKLTRSTIRYLAVSRLDPGGSQIATEVMNVGTHNPRARHPDTPVPT